MPRAKASSVRPAREPRSGLYVLGSAALAAAILGLTFFLLVRGLQWRGALAALRAEPGIEILGIERAGFFKRRLHGLRDPLAPTAESILAKHQLGPRSVEVALTEYHSLNTPYAKKRDEAEAARLSAWRDSMLDAIGRFADSAAKTRQADLEKITRMLFEARFPEAMKTVEIEWRDGVWFAEGELYAPDRERFVAAAPSCLVEGEFDHSGLVDLTASRTAILRERIESPDLFAVDLDAEPVHLQRMVRLVSDYDEVCERSHLPPPRLRLELAAAAPEKARERLAQIKAVLTSPGSIPAERFLADATVPRESGSAPIASLKLVALPRPD